MLKLPQEEVRVAVMGESGSDVSITSNYRSLFPFAIECKNQEVFKTLYNMYEQARGHDTELEPLLIIKMNRKEPLVVVDAEHFVKMQQRLNNICTTEKN